MSKGKKAIQKEKSVKTVIENLQEIEIEDDTKKIQVGNNIIVKTFPCGISSKKINVDIPSFQNSKPYVFENQNIPKPPKTKNTHPIDVRKSIGDSNLKVKVLDEDNLKESDLLMNLKAAIQQQS